MERVRTQSASPGLGPYSQAVKTNGFVFVSGQLGLDPQTGALVSGGFATETEQALKNVREILTAAGSDWSRVVKATIYLADIDHFTLMNEVYAKVLGAIPPARAAIQVGQLPLKALIEIDVIALA